MSQPDTGAKIAPVLGRVLIAALLSVLAGCQQTDDSSAPTFDAARQRAHAENTLVVVHFRLPGRPLSDAMDQTLTPQRLRALAPQFVHVRLDATQEVELFARLCGGGPRRGGGLATCVCDPAGDALACSKGYLAEPDLVALLADTTLLRDALRALGHAGSPAHALALAAQFTKLGRRDLARARYSALFADADASGRAQAAGALARLAVEDGDLVATRAWLRDADASAPHVALTRARLHLAAREPQGALAELVPLATHAYLPEHAAALFHLGRAQHEIGDDARALATFDLLCATYADTPSARDGACEAAHVRSGDHGHRHDSLPP